MLSNLEEEDRFRGVFAVRHERKSLFTQIINVEAKDIPKWKPRVLLSRRDLEDDDV